MNQPLERVFDWRPVYDPRSKAYPVSSVLPERIEERFVRWKTGEILDQGREGACVGFGWTAEILAEPVPVDIRKVSGAFPKDAHGFAHYVYKEAKKIDQWPGENYEGTSVLAGAKIVMKHGLLHEYRWAFSVADIINTLLSKGPVILGTNWYSGMYSAPNGALRISGNKVGGHCYLAIGYNPSSEAFDGEETVILQNSWGRGWGINGVAEMRVSDLQRLVDEGGEACVPVIRGMGGLKKDQ